MEKALRRIFFGFKECTCLTARATYYTGGNGKAFKAISFAPMRGFRLPCNIIVTAFLTDYFLH